MQPTPGIELVWLPVFCLLTYLIVYYIVSLDDRVREVRERPRFAAEVAAVAGVWYWLVLRGLGFSQSVAGMTVGGRGVLESALIEAAVWGLVVWPLMAWRVERVLRVPFWQSSDLTTRACVAVLVALLIMNLGRLATVGL